MSASVAMETAPLAEALARAAVSSSVRARVREIGAGRSRGALHVAVMREPYLTLVLHGRKTVESRFSVNRVRPFEAVAVGDVLALKEQSGPVVGLAVVEHVAFYELDPLVWRTLQERYSKPLCAEDPDFWLERKRARYATLMRLRDTERVLPVMLAKRDRRGWVRLAGTDAAQQRLAL